LAEPPDYDRRVFINCPFDAQYAPIFDAIVFAILSAGFEPVCALQRLDSGETRITKILEMIAACKYSVHDLSRIELDSDSHLPRFNMPLELGIDLGCRHYSKHDKVMLVLDAEKYRYQQYVSDLAGQDIAEHRHSPMVALAQVRNWLRAASREPNMPGPKQVGERYVAFRNDLPQICRELGLDHGALTFHDFGWVVTEWLRRHGAS
jgi:hypothetical protein